MLNIDRFEQYLAEGRLLRNQWVSTDAQGRATACWLAALSDEVASTSSPGQCLATDIPAWFAHLIPWMDDSCSATAWLGFAQRLGVVLRKPRTAEQWYRAEYVIRAICVREAMRHTTDTAVRTVCERVVLLCEQVANGAKHDESTFATAWAATTAAAATAAARATTTTARAAAATATWATAWTASADRIVDAVLCILEK